MVAMADESVCAGILELLLDHGADVNARVVEERVPGWMPLHWAAYFWGLDILDLLIENGALVDAIDFEGRTPLHFATYFHFVDLAEALIKRGADV
jgi:ankyrin repeat protein